jgi:hypothetical protein
MKVIRRLNDLVLSSAPNTPIRQRYRFIPALAIWPERTIDVSIESFTSADIRKMIELGRESARRALLANPDWLTATVGAGKGG